VFTVSACRGSDDTRLRERTIGPMPAPVTALVRRTERGQFDDVTRQRSPIFLSRTRSRARNPTGRSPAGIIQGISAAMQVESLPRDQSNVRVVVYPEDVVASR
jgi:hypothetical protein